MTEPAETIITENSLRGIVACWAVRQSPYVRGPDGLADVLEELSKRFRAFPGVEPVMGTHMLMVATPVASSEHGLRQALREVLHPLIETTLLSQPQVLAWNNRKNGREGMGFISRYELPPEPDDDFIDLYALEQNIVSSLLDEDRRLQPPNLVEAEHV